MIATIVHVKVRQEHIEEFIRATVRNHEESVRENGNMRFDVLQKEEDPTQFALYEAYASEELAAAHKHTPHYLEWRETVKDWMAEPREGVRYHGIRP